VNQPAHIDLEFDHRLVVLNILQANLPEGTKVWVFGSRATGRARRYSDLDLVIDASRRLTLDDFARLTEAFSDSDLPYRVDVVDWLGVEDRWRQAIAPERLRLLENES
jgi:type I restriction enzyme S subunit